jgi:Type II secretion system (T2SS), protein M subtype b
MSGERQVLSRAAALFILASLLALVWVGPVAAYLDVVGSGAQALVRAEAALARDRALAVAAHGGAAQADQTILMPTISDAQAVALLQESLKAAAVTAKVEIAGLQVLQAENLSGARRVGVRLRASGDIAGLDRLLYALAAARPLLYPDKLSVQGRAGAAPGAVLDFQIDVSAFKGETAS